MSNAYLHQLDSAPERFPLLALLALTQGLSLIFQGQFGVLKPHE
jgi:hypothetical protein